MATENKTRSGVRFAGASSIISTVFWISLVVFVLNFGLFIASMVLQDQWWEVVINITGTPAGDQKFNTGVMLPPLGYLIAMPVIGVISLFLLSGTSILVIPLNKTMKKEGTRSFLTWFFGLIIWIFSVFYVIMFFFNILSPIYNLVVATGAVKNLPKLDQSVINACNIVNTWIPAITFVSAGLLYWRVKAAYKKHHA